MSIMKNKHGFTLIEILIALFIFTIISVMIVGALHTVITAESVTEKKAERLRDLQMTFLLMSRDIEQAVNRPVVNSDGKEEAAFVGNKTEFRLTHMGYASTPLMSAHGTLQRTGYNLAGDTLVRQTPQALDQAPKTKVSTRNLLQNVADIQFDYLDKQGRFHEKWPLDDDKQPLPRAVRIQLTLTSLGKMTEIYLIAAEENETNASPESTEKRETKHERK